MNNLRIIYMGTAEFGLLTLKALHEKYNVVGVVCQPDKPSNRNEIKYSKIKEYAIENNIKIFQPQNIKNEYMKIIEEDPNIIITCAYGQIIPEELLNYPLYGCINIHASLLPKLRGGAPIHRAIINGCDKTGITIMKMSKKMDAGDIIKQEELIIDDEDTAGTLHDKLSIIGRDLMLKALPNIICGNITLIKQNENEATYGYNISKDDEHVSFNDNSSNIVNKVRGLNPWPGAYVLLDGKRIKLWKCKSVNKIFDGINGQIVELLDDGIGVKTKNGEVIITELQLEGKKRMPTKEFINGIVDKELLVGRIFE